MTRMTVARMKPEDVVQLAKDWVGRIYRDEKVEKIGLEELRFDNRRWKVTIGFLRPEQDVYMLASGAPVVERIYKVVTLDDATGEIVDLANREAA